MQINIKSKIKNYSINFVHNFDFLAEIVQIIHKIVIIDRNVYSLYMDKFTIFDENEILLFDASEQNKNINTVLSLCDKVIQMTAKRNLTIISFGGGITQDVTGFLASFIYRGIDWLFVPTTLLSQADSCMGGKTSLNHKHFKNIFGSFYPPKKVFLNVEFTKTLSESDFLSGMGEIVKQHFIGGADNIKKINILNVAKLKDDMLSLERTVFNSLQIKHLYISNDEFDMGKRNLLNFGHDFGHALETSSNYAISHGVAVLIGMVFANNIAVSRNLLQEKTAYKYNAIIKSFIKKSLPLAFFDKKVLLSAIQMDKKRVGNMLPCIVLKDDFTLEKLLNVSVEEFFANIDTVYNSLNM